MKKIRIIAVDDVEDILDIIEYNLTKEGMAVQVFSDASEALAEIFRNPPDVVISDRMMPVMDGIELCRRLKSSCFTRNIPVLMLTCKGTLKDRAEAMDAGAHDYVVKPVRMEELIRRVKLLLPHRGRQLTFGQ